MRSIYRDLYLWACERLYHEFAWTYDAVAWGVSFGRWSAWRSSVLGWIDGQHVLELGFGTGRLLGELSEVGFAVTGVEPSTSMQRQAARNMRGGVMRIQAVAQALPLPEGAYDTVLATFPAPYIAEKRTLAEVARVLKPGGRVVIAGLWVAGSGDSRMLRSAQAEMLDGIGAAMTHVGLGAALTETVVGSVRVGCLIGVKRKEARAVEEPA